MSVRAVILPFGIVGGFLLGAAAGWMLAVLNAGIDRLVDHAAHIHVLRIIDAQGPSDADDVERLARAVGRVGDL